VAEVARQVVAAVTAVVHFGRLAAAFAGVVAVAAPAALLEQPVAEVFAASRFEVAEASVLALALVPWGVRGTWPVTVYVLASQRTKEVLLPVRAAFASSAFNVNSTKRKRGGSQRGTVSHTDCPVLGV
jgi:hypothetical protein